LPPALADCHLVQVPVVCALSGGSDARAGEDQTLSAGKSSVVSPLASAQSNNSVAPTLLQSVVPNRDVRPEAAAGGGDGASVGGNGGGGGGGGGGGDGDSGKGDGDEDRVLSLSEVGP
jgi:hypothetical protein